MRHDKNLSENGHTARYDLMYDVEVCARNNAIVAVPKSKGSTCDSNFDEVLAKACRTYDSILFRR